MPTVHLICGSTGAGKTTYAMKLEGLLNAPRFSIDEWMERLFWKDAPAEPDFDWAWERVQRCEDRIWAVAKEFLARDLDVVLDLGLSKRLHRQRFYKLAQDVGAAPALHYVTADIDTRRERVRERNKGDSETFEIEVSDENFNFMEDFFEAPEGKELEAAQVVET
ncbi:MAG: ATP-binding protein [Rhodospirillales bacterium]|nr:ATP-binding protein [Rhodospirillales bacterium]